MAGDWIPVFDGLSQKREVLEIARRTSKTPHEVVGLLVDLWHWAQRESIDGRLPGLTVDDLAIALHVKRNFLEAVAACGWLAESQDGLLIPNAEHWLSVGAKARLANTKRQREYRAGQKVSRKPRDNCSANGATTALPQERTGEKREIPKGISNPPFPPELCTPEFSETWLTWLRYRHEKKLKTTPTMQEQLLKKLVGIGVQRAIAGLEHTMAMGWQGFREDDRQLATNGKALGGIDPRALE